MADLGSIFGQIEGSGAQPTFPSIGDGSSIWNLILPAALGGFGLLGNIMAGRSQQDLFNTYLNAEKRVQGELTPQAISAGTAALMQPLSNSLRQAVGNSVQADLAQRGLSQAPGIFGAAMAQALAPYAQKNLELAQQGYLQGVLGQRFQLPFGDRGPQAQNLSPNIMWLLNALQQRQQAQQAAAVTTDGSDAIPIQGGTQNPGITYPTAPNIGVPSTVDWSQLFPQNQ